MVLIVTRETTWPLIPIPESFFLVFLLFLPLLLPPPPPAPASSFAAPLKEKLSLRTLRHKPAGRTVFLLRKKRSSPDISQRTHLPARVDSHSCQNWFPIIPNSLYPQRTYLPTLRHPTHTHTPRGLFIRCETYSSRTPNVVSLYELAARKPNLH